MLPQELRVKTCVLSQDAVFNLAKDKSSLGQDLIRRASDHFQELSVILSYIRDFPMVWCDLESLGGSRLIERVKFNILEIQEMLENFAEKKEIALGVSIFLHVLVNVLFLTLLVF